MWDEILVRAEIPDVITTEVPIINQIMNFHLIIHFTEKYFRYFVQLSISRLLLALAQTLQLFFQIELPRLMDQSQKMTSGLLLINGKRCKESCCRGMWMLRCCRGIWTLRTPNNVCVRMVSLSRNAWAYVTRSNSPRIEEVSLPM